jgi:hypothetical protein
MVSVLLGLITLAVIAIFIVIAAILIGMFFIFCQLMREGWHLVTGVASLCV